MVSTVEQLRDRVQEALLDAVVVLTQRGVTAAASSRFDMGQALDWTRMDFRQRKRAMETVLLQALTGGEAPVGDAYAIVPMADVNIAVFVHAIPAAFTVAAARELVGKPFLRDHEHAHLLQGAHGPLHLIACHRGLQSIRPRRCWALLMQPWSADPSVCLSPMMYRRYSLPSWPTAAMRRKRAMRCSASENGWTRPVKRRGWPREPFRAPELSALLLPSLRGDNRDVQSTLYRRAGVVFSRRQ
ncbi:hypothetical protein OGV25_14400 [Pseudomonas sp. P1B16]|uniref:hypothetical protein n=1 Tax=Pseudomonas sp. P1B16 TaxID=2986074 RepID=UPI002A24E252|nr:hypothetical protein [Pseudomonas sp. P1B16]WPM24560.1 hypothetical protein OGV25_14400 [Pseudomonas sp. P1B16]